jgi:chromosome segregation ATPase
MPPLVDFSSALPWVCAGFLAGLLAFWLIRVLLGIDRNRIAALQAANVELTDLRAAKISLTNSLNQLDAERARLANETAQLSARAAVIPQLERHVSELRHAEAVSRGAVDAAKKHLATMQESAAADIAALREQIDQHSGTAKYYETEFGKLLAAYQELNQQAASKADLVGKLQNDYAVASREAGEATRLRSEIASAKAQIESLKVDVDSKTSFGKSQNDEIESLKRDHQSALASAQELQATTTHLAAELDRVQAELKAAPKDDLSGELERLYTEIARLAPIEGEAAALKFELADLKAKFSAVPKDVPSGEFELLTAELAEHKAALESVRAQERAASMDLHTTRNDLVQARTAIEETSQLLAERHAEIEQLKSRLADTPADVETYRRFKDALEAANRIASGLPEKG